MMTKIARRKVLRWVAGGLIGSFLVACRRALPEQPASFPVTRVVKKILKNLNRPHYNVRFIQPTEALDHDSWRLEIEGISKGPSRLSFAEMVQLLPITKQNSRMVCVEGWSFRANWEGFTMQALLELVEPNPNAKFLHFRCADGYYEVLSIEELREQRILFAYKMDGEYLSDEHGWPLRVILPARYGYKGTKSITKLTFSDKGGVGYWSTVGAYDADGFIQSGFDFPQDMPGERKQTVEGEQPY